MIDSLSPGGAAKVLSIARLKSCEAVEMHKNTVSPTRSDRLTMLHRRTEKVSRGCVWFHGARLAVSVTA